MGKLKSLKGRQGAKSLIAIAVALALGWIPLQRLLATTSAEATVKPASSICALPSMVR